MNKIAALIILLISLSVFAVAEDIASIIPNASIWDISEDNLREAYKADYEECRVGEDAALRVSNVEVCSYDMDIYYVFSGEANEGLSKIAYVLNVSDFDEESEIDRCYQTLGKEIQKIEGEPDSEKKSATIWKKEQYKIEFGKGKLSKYTGSDRATVAIIFKKGNTSSIHTSAPKTNQDSSKESGRYSGPVVIVKIGSKTVEVHKSFKEVMDGYEAFFDKYINFLKNPDLLKYSEMMLEYADNLQALDNINDEELSTGDMAYYLEVYARIMTKLSTFE